MLRSASKDAGSEQDEPLPDNQTHRDADDIAKDPSTSNVNNESEGDDQDEVSSTASINVVTIDTLEDHLNRIVLLEPDQHLKMVSEMFSAYCSKLEVTVPDDFIEYSVRGMQQLNVAGRTNFLYALAKGLGTMR